MTANGRTSRGATRATGLPKSRRARIPAPHLGDAVQGIFANCGRDRITFATMIVIPLMQLLLFGYAINTVPRDMPTARSAARE